MKPSWYLPTAGGIGAFLFLLAAHLTRLPGLSTVALEGYDDLFQLALGLKAAHGSWPGLDFFTNYGPGVSVLSALSWLWGNPILAEVLTGTILLTIGSFAFWRAGSLPGRTAHNLFLLFALVFLAPGWAKYYYVIWPGLFLLVLGDPCAVRLARAQRFRWLLLGFIVGLGAWFRIEIGLALSAALGGALVLRWRSESRDQPGFVLAGCAVAGALIPWAAYFGFAWIARGRFGGPGDLVDFYFSSTVAKAVDFQWVSAYPRFPGFFTPDSLIGCFGVGLAVSSLVMIGLFFPRASGALWRLPEARRAWCAAWVLLCLFPQCLHRFDRVHILHVVAAGFVAVSLGLAACFPGDLRRPVSEFWQRVGVPACLAVLLIFAARIYWKTEPRALSVLPRLRSIAGGLEGLDSTTPDLKLAAYARSRTRDGETILVPSVDTRMYVLVGRPFGGLFPHWSFRLPDRWQERQVAALQAQPAALLLHADYYRSTEAPALLRPLDFKGRNPRIDAFTNANFPVTVYETPAWRILAPATPR